MLPGAPWNQITCVMTVLQIIYHSADGVLPKYFHTASPSMALGSMNIGSRPAKRKAAGGIETLRAIPWVFAWTQMRLHIPAWLGGGSALKAVADTADGLAALRQMYRTWPFFKGFIDLVRTDSRASSLKVLASHLLKMRLMISTGGDRDLQGGSQHFHIL